MCKCHKKIRNFFEKKLKIANIDNSNNLELLDDELSARVVLEVVGFEHLRHEEGLQVLD